MLLLESLITLFAASALVEASPVTIKQRQSTPVLAVIFSNSASAITEQFSASTDSSAVSVASTTTYDNVRVQCLEVCIPEFHCTLFDKSGATIQDVNPGDTALSSLEIGQVTCAQGLSANLRRRKGTGIDTKTTRIRRRWSWRNDRKEQEPPVATLVSRQTTKYDGEAVFTDGTGTQTKVGFVVNQDSALDGSTLANISAATVDKSSLTTSDTSKTFTCQAYDSSGVSMGTFFGTSRYSYSFTAGVVATFLCSTGT